MDSIKQVNKIQEHSEKDSHHHSVHRPKNLGNEIDYEILQDMYLNHGYPAALDINKINNLNRSGSFADSSIKPKINTRESFLKLQPEYNFLMEELKIKQKMKPNDDKERY